MIDNLRYDQFISISPIIAPYYKTDMETAYFSILPTATQYARNAFFAGLLPAEMEAKHPQWWKNDLDEGGKNMHEHEFLGAQLDRLGLKIKHAYTKVNKPHEARKFLDTLKADPADGLQVLVYNFVDMISHAKTEMDVIKELANSDKAYRSLTKSWFQNSLLLDIIKSAQQKGYQLIITTDHGTINVEQPAKINQIHVHPRVFSLYKNIYYVFYLCIMLKCEFSKYDLNICKYISCIPHQYNILVVC